MGVVEKLEDAVDGTRGVIFDQEGQLVEGVGRKLGVVWVGHVILILGRASRALVGLGGIEVQVLKGEGLHTTRAVELGQLAEVHRQNPKHVNLNLEVVLVNIQLG